ncbi:recombinase family protein [Kitasatospora sp. NPDC059827]|uniref:recombinase family protein n=1 Tax=Kitasatospora sp. NPDC059827 TaxID=3346964 RepID=UPI003656B621
MEYNDCPKCEAPAGSPCRTLGGKTAAKYHTPRFILVPALREDLEVLVPGDRAPGKPWQRRPAPLLAPAPEDAAPPIRIGYARCSTAQQELASQIEALQAAGCFKIFQEKISTRIKIRPQVEAALTLARQFKEAAPDQAVILTVHEMKRLARNAAELMQLSADLQGHGILLELLTGPLSGVYDPNGMGSMFFAVLAAAAQIERNYIREKTLEGQQSATAKGNHGGRPKVIEDDMLTLAIALKDKGVPVPTHLGWTPYRPVPRLSVGPSCATKRADRSWSCRCSRGSKAEREMLDHGFAVVARAVRNHAGEYGDPP